MRSSGRRIESTRARLDPRSRSSIASGLSSRDWASWKPGGFEARLMTKAGEVLRQHARFLTATVGRLLDQGTRDRGYEPRSDRALPAAIAGVFPRSPT